MSCATADITCVAMFVAACSVRTSVDDSTSLTSANAYASRCGAESGSSFAFSTAFTSSSHTVNCPKM